MEQQILNTGLISLELVSKLSHIDIDMRSIVREYGINTPEITKFELTRIAKNSGFKAKIKKISLKNINGHYPLPAILVLKDNTFAVLLKINEENGKALVFFPSCKEPKDLFFSEISSIATDEIIILAHKMMTQEIMFGFKWFFAEILKYKMIILQVMLGSFVVQLFGLVTPLFTQVILDKVIVHQSLSTLDVLAFAFVAVMTFEFLLNISRNYIFIHTASKIDAKLGSKIFKHLFALHYVYFESRQVGNIISRVRELDTIREFITNKSVSLIIDMFFSLVFVAVMFMYSPKLTFVVLGFVASIAIIYIAVTPELRARLNDKFHMGAQSNSYLVESVTGVQTVKSLAIEGSMFRLWENYLGNYIKSSFNLSIMGTFTGAVSNLLQKAMTIMILYLGVKLVIESKLTIGQLIAFQMFSNQFSAPVLRLVNLWNELQQTLLAVDRLGDILNNPVEIQSKKAITLPMIHGAVKFDNLTFKYKTDAPNVLNGINLDIPAGIKVGIVGRSGSGKSTLAKLMQRLYYATEGTVFIDGIDIRNLNPVWLRTNIGVVLQENYLFSGTIRDNIAMPRPNASMEIIIEVAKISGAHDFISQLPQGYDTEVGERGSSLSGGQKQRIAIARALITDPKILIFDEATSALDYESEKIIQDNLNLIAKGRTTFIIAHRLSTVANSDIIICLDKGQIIEIGKHEELMNKQGYYYMLHSAQKV